MFSIKIIGTSIVKLQRHKFFFPRYCPWQPRTCTQSAQVSSPPHTNSLSIKDKVQETNLDYLFSMIFTSRQCLLFSPLTLILCHGYGLQLYFMTSMSISNPLSLFTFSQAICLSSSHKTKSSLNLNASIGQVYVYIYHRLSFNLMPSSFVLFLLSQIGRCVPHHLPLNLDSPLRHIDKKNLINLL